MTILTAVILGNMNFEYSGCVVPQDPVQARAVVEPAKESGNLKMSEVQKKPDPVFLLVVVKKVFNVPVARQKRVGII